MYLVHFERFIQDIKENKYLNLLFTRNYNASENFKIKHLS